MRGKVSYKFVHSAAYPYARIEAALALVFDVPPARIKHLRGRVKHLMVLGLPGSKPGKGARVTYGFDTVLPWLIALLLEDLGVPPAVAVKAVEIQRKKPDLNRWLKRAIDAESLGDPDKGVPANPVFLTLRPLLASSSWNEANPPLWIGFERRYDFRLHERLGHDPDLMKRFLDKAARDGTWACARNLTLDLKRLLGRLESDDYDFNKSIEDEP
jgi:hypothetical protein